MTQEDINLRFSQAVRFVWAMKSANKEVTKTYVSSTFNVSANAARIMVECITGKETDVEELTVALRQKAKAYSRELNKYKNVEPTSAPESEQVPEESSNEISRLNLAKDILLAMIHGYKETTPEELVDKAVKATDLLLEKVG